MDKSVGITSSGLWVFYAKLPVRLKRFLKMSNSNWFTKCAGLSIFNILCTVKGLKHQIPFATLKSLSSLIFRLSS